MGSTPIFPHFSLEKIAMNKVNFHVLKELEEYRRILSVVKGRNVVEYGTRIWI